MEETVVAPKRISVDLGLSNAFIGLKMNSNLINAPENLTPRPELQGWPSRTKITTFNIVHDEIVPVKLVKKLRREMKIQ